MVSGSQLSGDTGPRELLRRAESLLGRADPETAGLWPRASALLGCRALEATVHRLLEAQALDLRLCSVRVQLVCLRIYLRDTDLAARAGHAWSALRRACHHHPYELAPTATELRAWLTVVGELIQKVA
jgi:hypothetical protein